MGTANHVATLGSCERTVRIRFGTRDNFRLHTVCRSVVETSQYLKDRINGHQHPIIVDILWTGQRDIFQRYETWLYTRTVPRYPDGVKKTTTQDVTIFIRCWMLGQVLEDDLYRDMVMSALIARVKESTKDEVIACVDTVPVGIISKIYQLTPAGSPLRQLLVDLVVRHSGDAWFKRERYRGLPKDFLDEVLLGTVYETGRRLAKPKAKRLTEERAGVRRTEDAEKRSPADTTQQGTAPQPRDTWPWPPELVPVTEGSRPLASAMKSDKSKVNAAPKKVTFESDPRPELVGAEFGRDECEYHLHRKTKNTCWKKSCWGRHQKGCSG